MIIRDPDKVGLCDMIITVIWRVDRKPLPEPYESEAENEDNNIHL